MRTQSCLAILVASLSVTSLAACTGTIGDLPSSVGSTSAASDSPNDPSAGCGDTPDSGASTPTPMTITATDGGVGSAPSTDSDASSGSPNVSYVPAGNGHVIKVHPGDSIAAAIGKASSGDTILISAGTYKEELKISKSGIILRGESRDSVILDGEGKDYVLVADGASNVAVSNMTLRHAGQNNQGNDLAAVRTDDGWVLEDLEVDHMLGVGVGMFGEGVTVHRVVAQYNRSGIGGSSTKNSRMLDCTSAHNIGGSDSGGGKFTRSNGLTVERYTSFDNGGPGIWFDFSNINAVVRDGEFYNNHDFIDSNGKPRAPGRGIMIEISGIKCSINDDGSYTQTAEGPVLIEGNSIHDNDNSGLIVYASKNVTIRNNTFTNDELELKDGRAAPYSVRSLTVEGNSFKDSFVTADGASTKNYKTRSFSFDGDLWDRQGAYFKWDGSSYSSLSSVRSNLGFEEHGKDGSIP